MLLSELACLALAPFLLEPTINEIVYIVVGIAMSAAGVMVLRRNRVPHFHLFGVSMTNKYTGWRGRAVI